MPHAGCSASLEKDTGTRSASTGDQTGFNLLMWALCGRVTERHSKQVTLATDRDGGDTGGASKITEKNTRPSSMEALSERISAWTASTHALGKYHVLASTRFFRVVVYDTILRDNYPWQLAHELLMVYFEDLDNSTVLTLGNIVDSGALDARMARAKAQLAEHYKGVTLSGIFRTTNPADGGGGGGGGGTARKWNGKDTASSAIYCLSYNLENDHPKKHLTADGKCKHRHVCDAWVTEGGDSNGRCGGSHPRKQCKHPHKTNVDPKKG